MPLVNPRNDAALPDALPSFPALFRDHFGYVWASLRRLGIPARDLEDLTHEVFLQVFRQRDTYEPGRPLRPWLFGFAFRIAGNHRRLARHRLERPDVDTEAIDPAPTADARLMTHQAQALAEQALASLPIDRRALLLLHEMEGQSMPEIAKTLEIPLNTAYSRLRLARRDFAAAVERLRPQGDCP